MHLVFHSFISNNLLPIIFYLCETMKFFYLMVVMYLTNLCATIKLFLMKKKIINLGSYKNEHNGCRIDPGRTCDSQIF